MKSYLPGLLSAVAAACHVLWQDAASALRARMMLVDGAVAGAAAGTGAGGWC